MSSTGGSNALMALKSKMQGLREELDKANDQLESKCREFEAERESRTQVINCICCKVAMHTASRAAACSSTFTDVRHVDILF